MSKFNELHILNRCIFLYLKYNSIRFFLIKGKGEEKGKVIGHYTAIKKNKVNIYFEFKDRISSEK